MQRGSHSVRCAVCYMPDEKTGARLSGNATDAVRGAYAVDDFSHFAWTSLGYIGLAFGTAIAVFWLHWGLCMARYALKRRRVRRVLSEIASVAVPPVHGAYRTPPFPRRPNGTDLSRLRVGEHRLGRPGSPPSNGAA